MRRGIYMAAGLLLLLMLAACGGITEGATTTGSVATSATTLQPSTTATTTAAAATTTSAAATTTTTANPSEVDAVKSAVRAYSAAFLGGHAKQAWLMRTPAAQARESYAEFAAAVSGAKAIYGDAKMTSLVVTVTGAKVLVTYTYDISEIDQTDQVWLKEGGKWLVDN